MNMHRCCLRLGALVILSSVASVLGCSNNSNAGPSALVDSGMPSNTQSTQDAATPESSTGDDGGSNVDTGSADVAADGGSPCTSDSSLCNSCSAPDADFHNACSSQVTNCVPFTGTVPPHPTVN